jgi:outer membrane biogenesis lipoprotein LolB
MRTTLLLLLVAAFAYLVLPACETTKPRGPQSKSSYMPWDRPKAGQGAGALGSMMPRQD